MALLSLDQLKEHLRKDERPESELRDPPLLRALDSQDAAIVRRHGPHTGNITDRRPVTWAEYGKLGGRTRLRRPATALVSLTVDGVDQLAAASIDSDPRLIYWSERPFTGSRFRLEAAYTPIDDTDERIDMLLRLVRLAITDRGLQYHREPGVTEVRPDIERDRERILGRINYYSPVWRDVYAG